MSTSCRMAGLSNPATRRSPPSWSSAATARLPRPWAATRPDASGTAMSAVVDFPVKPEARDYLARFARDAGEPGWLAARRQQGMTRFAELGFPTRKSENWRYLDLQQLERRPLLPAAPVIATDHQDLRDR